MAVSYSAALSGLGWSVELDAIAMMVTGVMVVVTVDARETRARVREVSRRHNRRRGTTMTR